MAATKRYFGIFLELFFLLSVCCLPEPGKKVLKFNKEHPHGGFPKTMNKGYTIAMKGQCSGYNGTIHIKWRLAVSQCAEWFSSLKDNSDKSDVNQVSSVFSPSLANHSLNWEGDMDCKTVLHFPDITNKVKELITSRPPPTESNKEEKKTENEDEKKTNVVNTIGRHYFFHVCCAHYSHDPNMIQQYYCK
ncbi:uncharacterized protein LOC111325575 [Stylophora pistillata]|uniref:uncharacterized protein LOC111325575 n=1 Tax=Stylophora pistillata TaxID=50429 RepID=UPI000C05018B|nr:uncharacterized protein LOC111325575 [Stylophora pistillata]